MASHEHQHPTKVAVITRTKARGLLLERAIKSVHQQTMSDFVHVIINDAGDPKVVDDLVKKYAGITKGRVKVIHNQVSHGMEAASNKAIKSVDSDFIAIHDDDDSWHPDFLRATTECLEETGSMGVVVHTELIYESILGDSVQEYDRQPWLPRLHSLGPYDLCRDNFAKSIAFLYRRRVFDRVGYYDESLRLLGDWDFALRFLREFEIEFLSDARILAFWHIRPNIAGSAENRDSIKSVSHEQYLTDLANKLLREDLRRGGLNIGYVFNKFHLRRSETEEVTAIDQTEQKIAHDIAELERILPGATLADGGQA